MTARRLRNILGGSAGNFVEWFDWFAYTAFAIYFSRDPLIDSGSGDPDQLGDLRESN